MSAQRRSSTKRRSSGRRSSRPPQSPVSRQRDVATDRVTAVAEPEVEASPAEPAETHPVARTQKPSRRKAAAVQSVDAAAGDGQPPRRSQRTIELASPARENPLGRVVDLNRFNGIQRFYRDSMSEIRKVIWPDKDTARNLTLVVIALSVVLGILLGGIDYVLFQLFEALP